MNFQQNNVQGVYNKLSEKSIVRLFVADTLNPNDILYNIFLILGNTFFFKKNSIFLSLCE